MSRIAVAHVLGAVAIGALEAARLGGAELALAIVPLFAATGSSRALRDRRSPSGPASGARSSPRCPR